MPHRTCKQTHTEAVLKNQHRDYIVTLADDKPAPRGYREPHLPPMLHIYGCCIYIFTIATTCHILFHFLYQILLLP